MAMARPAACACTVYCFCGLCAKIVLFIRTELCPFSPVLSEGNQHFKLYFFDPRFGVEFGGDLKTFWQALEALPSLCPLCVIVRGRNLLTRVELLSGGTVADAV